MEITQERWENAYRHAKEMLKAYREAITKQPKLFYHGGGEMFNLYLSKGDKRTTKRILLRNAREEELPALKRVFLNNGWRVVIERIDGDD
jgi:hypothetical protein